MPFFQIDRMTFKRTHRRDSLCIPAKCITAFQPSTLLAQPDSGSCSVVLIPLSNVAHPEAALTDAKIYDQKGVIIGFVDKVILDAGGKAVELKVDVGNYPGMGTKMVAMMAGDFKFDTGHKTLITNLTNAQIQVIAGGH